MNEIDYLLRIDPVGVITFTGRESIVAQIREWIDTPKGEVWGRPAWGNLLSQFKHLPINDYTAASIESFILLTINEDIPNIAIDAIRVIPMTNDSYKIIVEVLGSIIEESLNL